ncbi:MAG: SpoIIE family protein phosphatase [Treponemataceae bacterium]|nr:SpoIIE family protein phosphatase [Treponemataceae bacterium]
MLQTTWVYAYIVKLFPALALTLVVRTALRHDSENLLGWAIPATFYILARDIIFFTGIIPFFLLPLSDVVVPFFIVGPLLHQRKKGSLYGYILGLFLYGLLIILLFLFSGLSYHVFCLLCFVAVVISFFLLAILGRTSSPMGGVYALMGAAFVVLYGGHFVVGASSEVLSIFYASHYLLMIASLLLYIKQEDNKLISDRDGLADNIDILYNFVLNSTDALHSGGDLNKLLEYVAKTITEGTNAEGTLIFLVDDVEYVVSGRVVYGKVYPFIPIPEGTDVSDKTIQDWILHVRLPIGQGLIGETAQTGKPLFIPYAQKEGRIVSNPLLPVGSLLVIPLLIEDHIIGVAVCMKGAEATPFLDRDFDRAVLLAGFAAVVINTIYSFQDVSEKSDIDTVASISQDIQRALQPKRLPKLSSCSIGVFSENARGINSDYYDIIPVSRERVYFVIGDIAGKGIQAGLVMVMIRALVHFITSSSKDASTLLSWINRGITGKIDIDHFATLQVVVYNPLTGDCEFANAGHRPLLIWKHHMGLVDALEVESVPIGVERNTEYQATHFKLEKNDVLLLYTDGVIEAINPAGKQYGIKSLTTALHKYHDLEGPEIAKKIKEDLRSFMGTARQHDDQTIVAIKAKN